MENKTTLPALSGYGKEMTTVGQQTRESSYSVGLVDASNVVGSMGMGGMVTANNLRGKVSISPDLEHKLNNRIPSRYDARFNDIANGSIFFQRELEFINPKLFETDYGPIQFRQVFPQRVLEDAGIIQYTYRVGDKVGQAEIIGSNVADLPRADVSGKEVTQRIKGVGIAYGMSIQELASAQFAGQSLAQLRAQAARRAMMQFMNELAFIGRLVSDDLPGLLDNPSIPIGAVTGGTWASKIATPDAIVADITEIFGDVFTNSLQTHRANTLLLPTEQWNLIANTPRSPTSDTTILDYVVQNSPYITSSDQIIPIPLLANAFTGDTENGMIAYERAPENVEFVMGLEQTFLDPQERALEILIPSWATVAGLLVYRPLAFQIKTGI